MIDENQLEQMRHEYWQMSADLTRMNLIAGSLKQELVLLNRYIRRLKTDLERIKKEKKIL